MENKVNGFQYRTNFVLHLFINKNRVWFLILFCTFLIKNNEQIENLWSLLLKDQTNLVLHTLKLF